MPSPCLGGGDARCRGQSQDGAAGTTRALLTSTHPRPPSPARRARARLRSPRQPRREQRSGPSPPRHGPGYLLFTVRNMDLLMSVPTPLLAWQR